MTFDEVLAQVLELLQREGRVSYRALKRRFSLDDDYLEDLKDELIKAKQLARDEEGAVLVWIGASPVPGSKFQVPSSQSPTSIPQPLTSSTQTLDSARPEAERRQLTVLFCDLVDSTTLSALLDPEELREVVHAYHETCAAVISCYAGHTAQHLGDGLLVYFGYPAAHEDDAQRAVRTGLEVLAGLQPLNAQLPPTIRARLPHPIQVRIGIHTGLVVVGEIGSTDKHEILALGETPNIAARLQGLAEPDTVVISTSTYRLTHGFFACRALGPQSLKGISAPLEVYHILGESGVQSRFEVAVTTGLTPLVGREQEVGLLLERWERAKGGAGQIVLLNGEPGIGKSRLVQVLKEWVATEQYTRLECRCSPYHQNSALYPVIDLLQRVLQFTRDDSPQEKLRKLEVGARRAVPLQFDVVPLVAALLSLPHPDGYPPLTLTPQRQKQKTLEAVLTWLLAEAERQPLPLIVEDLHWADPSMLEFLTLLIDQVPTARLLTLLTFRPEFTPPWASHSHLTLLTLSRLPRQQAEVMVTRVTGGKALPTEVVQQIVAKTDGVPLFVEELTKTVLESGLVRATNSHYELTGPLPPLAIPTTLQDSLVARLDRLTPVKEIAQVGATLGREFSYDLLQAISPLDEVSLQQALAKLVEAELLYQRGLPPQAQYIFKHALIQDAAYQSLLKSKRRQYHKQIAEVLQEKFPENVEAQPELLAHHYTEAGLTEQAIPCWQRAGQRAIERSANQEAIRHLSKGLELLRTLPNTPDRIQQELFLQTTLGPTLIATKGYAAPEVKQTYTRAWELYQQMGETTQFFSVLWGLWAFHVVRAEHEMGYKLGEQLLSLAQRQQDPDLLLEAQGALGTSLFFLGKVGLARAHLEQGIALYDPKQHHTHAFLYAQDPGVVCLCYVAWVLWMLGYPDQALKRIHEAQTLAQELSHPYSSVFALTFATQLHQFRREEQVTRERAEKVIALSAEQGFVLPLATGTIQRGWALAEQGQEGEGIAQMRQGLATWQATGAELLRPSLLALLAAVHERRGQTEEGLSLLSEALAAVDKSEERVWEAELYRLKGELTLAQSSVQNLASSVQTGLGSSVQSLESEAEECFQKAIAIAQRQQAKSLELRATTSLARLWQQQGKREEARQMLSEIYSWFTEGFDTADLQEAKALLEKLA